MKLSRNFFRSFLLVVQIWGFFCVKVLILSMLFLNWLTSSTPWFSTFFTSKWSFLLLKVLIAPRGYGFLIASNIRLKDHAIHPGLEDLQACLQSGWGTRPSKPHWRTMASILDWRTDKHACQPVGVLDHPSSIEDHPSPIEGPCHPSWIRGPTSMHANQLGY